MPGLYSDAGNNEMAMNTKLTGSNLTDAQALPTKITKITRVLAFSTTTPLGANAVYTSPTIDVTSYRYFSFRSFSEVAGTFLIQISDDGVTWDNQTTGTQTANTPNITNNQPCGLKYIRVVFTNGATAQTQFRFSLYLSPL